MNAWSTLQRNGRPNSRAVGNSSRCDQWNRITRRRRQAHVEAALRFCPALCITAKEVETCLQILDDVIYELQDEADHAISQRELQAV